MSYKQDKVDPMSDDDSSDFDAALFGKVDIPASGKVVAVPTSIMDIWPDPRQPRRAIPLAIRGEWDGSPASVPALIRHWRQAVEGVWGRTIDVAGLLDGTGEMETETVDPVVSEFVELISLAASIYQDRLINPVAIARRGNHYRIESGERRWLAYHLLHIHAGRDYERIPAIIGDKVNVWRQASENGNRRPLNAIGMARQLALLVMDMYEGDDGIQFDDIEALVYPGGCDRAYYAQVQNGQVYRIKRGIGQRILDATGLKSKKQLSDYRTLLSIPDNVWVQADLESWPEFKIRTYVDGLEQSWQAAKETERRQIEAKTNNVTLPDGNVSPKNDQPGSAKTNSVRSSTDDLTPENAAALSAEHKTLNDALSTPTRKQTQAERDAEQAAWQKKHEEDERDLEAIRQRIRDGHMNTPAPAIRQPSAPAPKSQPTESRTPFANTHINTLLTVLHTQATMRGNSTARQHLSRLKDMTAQKLLDELLDENGDVSDELLTVFGNRAGAAAQVIGAMMEEMFADFEGYLGELANHADDIFQRHR